MIIPTFQKGRALSAADLNLAMDAVRRARVLPGAGVKLTETLNGTVVSVPPAAPGGGIVPQSIFPWQIYNSPFLGSGTPPSDQNLRVKVRQGVINNIIQGNLNEEFICSETCHFYDEATLEYSSDGSFAKVVSHIVKQGEMPEPSQELRPTKVYLRIGIVNVEENQITSIFQFFKTFVSGSMVMSAASCTTQARQWVWFVPYSEY